MQELIKKGEPDIKRELNRKKLMQQQSSVSEDSMKQIEEEFNCKKYI